MNNVNSSRKPKKKILFALLLIIIYLTILLFISIKPSGVARVKYGSVKSSYNADGMILRNEKVVYSNQNGYILRKIQNNTRVPKGFQVIRLSSKKSGEDLEAQLEDINEKIKLAKNRNSSGFTDDINKLNTEITEQLLSIKKDAKMGIFTTHNNIDNLSILLEKKNTITTDNPFIDYNITEMEREKNDIENSIKNLYTYVVSPEAGFISYNIDGYENINIKNVIGSGVFDRKPKENMIKEEGNFVNIGEPLFKVIDNYEWYIYLKIPTDDFILSDGEKIKLNIKGYSLDAKVMMIDNNDNVHYALLLLNQQYNDFLTDRFVKLQLIKNFDEGMMIPSDSIFSDNGKNYVYKYGTGEIRKVEVNVLASDGEKAIVESVDKLDGLKIYDEVVTDKKLISKYLNTRE